MIKTPCLNFPDFDNFTTHKIFSFTIIILLTWNYLNLWYVHIYVFLCDDIGDSSGSSMGAIVGGVIGGIIILIMIVIIIIALYKLFVYQHKGTYIFIFTVLCTKQCMHLHMYAHILI